MPYNSPLKWDFELYSGGYCNHHNNQFQTILITPKANLSILLGHHSPKPPSRDLQGVAVGTFNMLSISIDLPILTFYINGTMYIV